MHFDRVHTSLIGDKLFLTVWSFVIFVMSIVHVIFLCWVIYTEFLLLRQDWNLDFPLSKAGLAIFETIWSYVLINSVKRRGPPIFCRNNNRNRQPINSTPHNFRAFWRLCLIINCILDPHLHTAPFREANSSLIL